MRGMKVLTGLLAALLLSACMPPQKQNYETTLFDTGRVHTVEVNIAPEDWQENRDPEEILDTQLLIRYFAVHNFLLNYDSYTGQKQ